MLLHLSRNRLHIRNSVLPVLNLYRNRKLERDFWGLLQGVDFRHEVVLEDLGNALEERHVYGFTLENIVHVLPMAPQSARELAYAQARNRQIFLYPFASVNFHFVSIIING